MFRRDSTSRSIAFIGFAASGRRVYPEVTSALAAPEPTRPADDREGD
jgi:hypothetical protein